MRDSQYFIFPLSFLMLLFITACGESRKISTDNLEITEWVFKKTMDPDSNFHKAVVPGNVYTDLIRNGLIPDPFYGDNEGLVQWVGKHSWEYRGVFTLDAHKHSNTSNILVFEGLDTHCDIILNDSLLQRTNNMFVAYEFTVNDLIRPGTNEIILRFDSAIKEDSVKQVNHPFLYPEPRSFSRKAPYQYGWDWGPVLAGMGIWKSVYLKSISGFQIKESNVYTLSIDRENKICQLNLTLEGKLANTLKISGKLENTDESIIDTVIHKPNKNVTIPFSVDNAQLWWPNGRGEQSLHVLELHLEDETSVLEQKIKFGISEINLVQEKDEIGTGFYFRVNGEKIFAKGANYIPTHSYPSATDRQKTINLLADAAEVGMNMIRVWGGGYYPEDWFYDACDSLGLMVWQDFMFACNFYPADSHFLDNVKTEVVQNVGRIMHHPSLALWCGNNEIDEAWHNWGYQESLNYSESDQETIWKDYQTLFDTLIPSTIASIDPVTSYIPTSPKIGWGNIESLYEGDMHYWGVWWGAEPFELYREKTGRFMSEYGFQSFPSKSVVDSYFGDGATHLADTGLLNHQKHPRGMALIDEYMKRDFHIPENFDQYIYLSQLVQKRGMEIAIESHRKNKPNCMGTLYWQLNDCWPAISWSSIDYDGNWKAFHYALKRLYADQLIIVEEKAKSISIYLTNEDAEVRSGDLHVRVGDFNSKEIMNFSKNLRFGCEETVEILELDSDSIYSNHSKRELFFEFILEVDGREKAQTIYYPVNSKNQKLTAGTIEVSIVEFDTKSVTLSFHSEKLIRNLYLDSELPGRFSDNYFDLLPGKSKKIEFSGSVKEPAAFVGELKMQTLNEGIELVIKK